MTNICTATRVAEGIVVASTAIHEKHVTPGSSPNWTLSERKGATLQAYFSVLELDITKAPACFGTGLRKAQLTICDALRHRVSILQKQSLATP